MAQPSRMHHLGFTFDAWCLTQHTQGFINNPQLESQQLSLLDVLHINTLICGVSMVVFSSSRLPTICQKEFNLNDGM